MNVKGRPFLGSGKKKAAKPPCRCRWPTCAALEIHLAEQTIGRGVNAFESRVGCAVHRLLDLVEFLISDRGVQVRSIIYPGIDP